MQGLAWPFTWEGLALAKDDLQPVDGAGDGGGGPGRAAADDEDVGVQAVGIDASSVHAPSPRFTSALPPPA